MIRVVLIAVLLLWPPRDWGDWLDTQRERYGLTGVDVYTTEAP